MAPRAGRLGVALATVVLGAAGLAVVPVAEGAPQYRVVDADRDPYSGIYLRDGTSMDNVRRIAARHVVYGRRVTLQCGTNGEAVGPFTNRRWHLVEVSEGPSRGQVGWLPDRYLDTPNRANQVTPGEPECGPATSVAAPEPRGGGTVYFEPPLGRSDPRVGGAVHVVPSAGWSRGVSRPTRPTDCISDRAAKAVPELVNGRRVTTLAGWSLGRMGPIYAIGHSPALARQVNFILIYDPGTLREMTGSCDTILNTSAIIRGWLSRGGNRTLMILAGDHTRDRASGGSHQGIQRVWFSALRGSIGRNVIVCNLDGVDHRSVLRTHAGMMTRGRTTTCPAGARRWTP